MRQKFRITIITLWIAVCAVVAWAAGAAHSSDKINFPPSLASYQDGQLSSILDILIHRIEVHPFNLVASLIFLMAIIHTFMAGKFMKLAHDWQHEFELEHKPDKENPHKVHYGAEIMHLLGEVEAIFGMWLVPLMFTILFWFDWGTVVHYVQYKVNYIEPMFVVVIMTLASTKPILYISEVMLAKLAKFLYKGWFCKVRNGLPIAWWLSILTVAPVLGSFITEPAAMTISALLLAKQFYYLKPSPRFAYATLGLLFVNISVGGTLTHFAAPPVLMVAAPWGWDIGFMIMNFGWKAVLGIIIANILYSLVFRKEFDKLELSLMTDDPKMAQKEIIPAWIIMVHLLFMVWTVFNAHYPVMFIGGFLFFLSFAHATRPHQGKLDLKPPMLVGFFLAGLVTHGGLQGWWIAPVLGNLPELPLFLGAITLTAFNDNAAITYLSTLVPNLSDSLKYAVVAGAVTGGGLTVIANAPNPAGQSILAKYFPGGINPLGLAAGAIVPTIIMSLCYKLL